ncbi:unnamed protein product [Microthlaspi erraticum]|uniref:Uncharacterized protein n=1 Tax=Microthlaspi erraticum TaxID=1685480 RepID=A0A6D2JQF9_9BRAS|nr:unnamed protein product [Microthlaspi erraticum]
MVQADHDDYTIEGQNFGIRSNAEFNESVDKNEDLYGNNSFIMSRVQSKEDIEKTIEVYGQKWKVLKRFKVLGTRNMMITNQYPMIEVS